MNKDILIQLLKDPSIRKIIKDIFLEESCVKESQETPVSSMIQFFNDCKIGGDMYNEEIKKYLSLGFPKEKINEELKKFFLYWTEPTLNGKKQRWQKQQTFDYKRRFATWMNNVKDTFVKNNTSLQNKVWEL